ncbi:VCBS repeat-containing protein [Tunicatimonas pelagia]|uniref:VCBS repeat-containing protein n=1 Tax=Tunicatimonas pelagia TaxID=931531 RepID=UPI002666E3D2|nr:VCBS repeat-containing protein [Tunicatimonas pelagia]WKN44192.1 VCBS repeat-containing protein [Tunicatimonas pelagia]
MSKVLLAFTSLLLLACQSTTNDNIPAEKLFSTIPTEASGLTFQNDILESEQLHYYKYQYMYIGGGVAAADFNNDGLEDLFFTANIYHNKLFLNQGNLQFKDITPESGIEKRVGFDTGVSVADVNHDGFLDIYICRAGWFDDPKKLANILYINNGDLTFTESAADYGLDNTDRSISSTFFDYDRDGDLDVYIANAPANFELTSKVLNLKNVQADNNALALKGGDKLYQNQGDGTFTDVSQQAGILPDLGFGLHPQVGDLNGDGWPDIFVSNDFIGPDFAYVNQQDGTFKEGRNELFKHISYYSMGADFADVNNDGLAELFVLDMSPEDYVRSKTTMAMMPIDRFWNMVENDHHHQYMHNVLQKNNGNSTFSEVGYLSGIAKTDWSWSALLADFNLDGLNDLYVTNGIYRDVVDRDANNSINKKIDARKASLREKDFYEFTQSLPQEKLTNYFFKNEGSFAFADATEDWADQSPTFSNGAVYADLDNDGDLDVVVNNIDEPATLLRNNARQTSDNHHVQIKLVGSEKNPFAIGTKVKIFLADGSIQTKELIVGRGYMSSVTHTLTFGLGDDANIERAEILWPNGNIQIVADLAVNQLNTIRYQEASFQEKRSSEEPSPLFVSAPFPYQHNDPAYNDFDKQLLIPHKLSQTGPALAQADVNGNGLEDLFLGGGKGQAAQLLLANSSGKFTPKSIPDFEQDQKYEDVGAHFFDADSDGDADLYVVSGSYEFDEGSALLADRLYLNQGQGRFSRADNILPDMLTAGSVVTSADYDADGDLDLFVGGRVMPGKYLVAPTSYILENTGRKFRIVTTEVAPELEEIGMVTDAVWKDLDQDGDTDLLVTGEWMGIEVFLNERGQLVKSESYQDLSAQVGWWNKLLVEDVDNDGDLDIVAGNLGLNHKFSASEEKPLHVYTDDFDENGGMDIVLAKYYDTKLVPVRGKGCTSQKMPFISEKFEKYSDFANADLQGIFGEEIENSLHFEVTEFRSGLFYNNGNASFQFAPFSAEGQMAPINSILYEDFTNDGKKDLLMAGNNYQTEVETTRYDAGIGLLLARDGEGSFQVVSNRKIGLYLDGNIRAMASVRNDGKRQIVVANNDSYHQLFHLMPQGSESAKLLSDRIE